MCGISGIFATEPIHPGVMESVVQGIAHRGPDAHGVFFDRTRRIGLGHNRLSIIDLSDAANQPFHSANGRYVIVFNGEVYNFSDIKKELTQKYGTPFRTTSDTEVIVEAFAAWGTAAAAKFEGMFALAIFDQHEHKLYLFRDRLGKKPLYYFYGNGLFAFASEIKGLLRHPAIARDKKVNHRILGTFLHLGYIPEPHTIYTNVHKFPAGHIGEIGADLKLHVGAYWTVDQHADVTPLRDEAQVKKQLHTLLDDAVRRRLISDVPLGSFLSGGTDSSLVTALASRHTATPLKTFSIGFKESKFDERRYARAVATHLKTEHTEYSLLESEAVHLLETYLRHFDEPFADTSAIPTMLVSHLARKDVTVALTGDGGDELFQGYGAYPWAQRLQNPFFKAVQSPLAWAFEKFGDTRLKRIAHLLHPVERNQLRSHIFSQEQYLFEQTEIREKLLSEPSSYFPFTYADPRQTHATLTSRELQAVFDLKYYLKDDLLVKVDRASMYYALECRSPLLDYNVVEFALQVPLQMKVKGNVSKWILKTLLGDYLPKDLVHRPKWGFSIPLVKWLKTDLHHLIDQYLSDAAVEQVGLVKREYVQQLKDAFMNGEDYRYNRLWVLIVIHKWLMENE